MRYASIRKLDISNGEGLGVTLFTQGCPFHCKNCFNPETHDFDGGKEYTIDTKNAIVSLINRAQIKRFSILGGEPLIERNKEDMIDLCSSIKEIRPDIKIELYMSSITLSSQYVLCTSITLWLELPLNFKRKSRLLST